MLYQSRLHHRNLLLKYYQQSIEKQLKSPASVEDETSTGARYD